MFTSGTTGKPKTVVHPKMYAAGWHSYQKFALGVTGDAVFWSAADPGWAYGLYTAIIAPLAAGTTSLLTTGTFDPMATWEVLDRDHVTDFAAAQTALRAMRACGGQRPLPFLRHLSSAGEPLSPDVLEWTTSLGVPVHDQFGQTELGMPAGFPHHPALEIPVQASAMGRSLPGWSVTVLSMDSDDAAGPNEVGRLAIDVGDSPFYTFTGYGVERNEPADRLTRDGRYYLTGDLATLDESEVLHFSSRDDDVILMAGYRIGPFEVESSLLRHPDVREVAVVAAPDEARGEVVHAFVVPSENVTPDEDLIKALQQWVKDTYAAHAYPRRITFVANLPKTPSGKIQRVDLRRQARSEQ
jgi:acetyl-CoA synthetase